MFIYKNLYGTLEETLHFRSVFPLIPLCRKCYLIEYGILLN